MSADKEIDETVRLVLTLEQVQAAVTLCRAQLAAGNDDEVLIGVYRKLEATLSKWLN